MDRSYRGLGLVVLTLLVVAPLTLFAVLSLFEDESADGIRLSLDGEHWTSEVDGALLASEEAWTPGEARSAIVYVRNSGPGPVDAVVTVVCRSSDEMVLDGQVMFTSQVDHAAPVPFSHEMRASQVAIDGLEPDSSVPVTVRATFAETAPIGSTVDSDEVLLSVRLKGARSVDAGPPSLLDATGAQLWLAPILLVVAAGVAVRVRAGRTQRRAASVPGDTPY